MPHKDPEVSKRYHAEYREKNRELLREKVRFHFEQNRERYRQSAMAYTTRRRKSDPAFRAAGNLRSRIGMALRYQAVKRQHSQTRDLLGCSFDELKVYLESLFSEGMTWENYGRTGWHIDHIIPLSSFDLSNESELRKAVHFSNLQPLWAKDNILKGNKLEKDEK